MNEASLFLDEQRRRDVRRSGLNGIEDVEVDATGRLLSVRLFAPLAGDLGPANVRIEGGDASRSPRAVEVEAAPDAGAHPAVLSVRLDRRGDRSRHTLRLVQAEPGRPGTRPLPGFDPVCSALSFRFDAAGDGQDCRPPQPRADAAPGPDLDYLAKDFASFRRLIVDRLALAMPGWRETHAPDLGVALIDLLAYVGDHLSYRQDAVATEAYLQTARRRISVRRHARLLDYRLHDGCNARVWMRIESPHDFSIDDARRVRFIGGAGSKRLLPDGGGIVGADTVPAFDAEGLSSFEPVDARPIRVRAAHGAMRLHAWGSAHFELPAGTTRATLIDRLPAAADRGAPPGAAPGVGAAAAPGNAQARPAPDAAAAARPLHLAAGDFILLMEVASPVHGRLVESGPVGAAAGVERSLPGDPDPARRHVVRLTRVEADVDPLYDLPILHIEWDAADALPFALAVSTLGPPPHCTPWGPAQGIDLAIACGNLVLADHGRRIRHEALGEPVARIDAPPRRCLGPGLHDDEPVLAAPFRPTLANGPLTCRQAVERGASAAALMTGQDPRAASAQLWVRAIPGRADGLGPLFELADLADAGGLAVALASALVQKAAPPSPAQRELLTRLHPATLRALRHHPAGSAPSPALSDALRAELRRIVEPWLAVPDLLDSGADDRHVVAEVDDDGRAQLRFGDGECGRRPDAGMQFYASYRVGIGAEGNVGADVLVGLVSPGGPQPGATVSNPLPARGGVAPEPVDDARRLAPTAMRATLRRAVTADDYARLAEADPRVQRAAATLRWSGSRTVVSVAIDPRGTEMPAAALLAAVAQRLERVRRLGHAVEVVAARYVALEVAMTVQVLAGADAGEVRRALLDEFTARGAGGAVFAPDRLSFGTRIEASRLVERAQRIAGVESVVLTRLERAEDGPNGELESGLLAVAALEIPRLADDPDHPERGRFRLTTKGGR